MLAKLGYSRTSKSPQYIQLLAAVVQAEARQPFHPFYKGGCAGELSAMKGKLQPTLIGYTDCQILSNIARPNWQLEISHGGRIYTRAVDRCYHQDALFFFLGAG